MGILDWLKDWFGSSGDDTDSGGNPHDADSGWDMLEINPASGLPMVGGIGGLDIDGNPYGFNLHEDDSFSLSGSSDDWLGSFDSGDAWGSDRDTGSFEASDSCGSDWNSGCNNDW